MNKLISIWKIEIYEAINQRMGETRTAAFLFEGKWRRFPAQMLLK